MLGSGTSASPDWAFILLGSVLTLWGIRRLLRPRRAGLRELERHRRLSLRVPWLYSLPGMRSMTEEPAAVTRTVWAGFFYLGAGIAALARGSVGLIH